MTIAIKNPYTRDPETVTVAEATSFLREHGLRIVTHGDTYRLQDSEKYSVFPCIDTLLSSVASMVAAGPELRAALLSLGQRFDEEEG